MALITLHSYDSNHGGRHFDHVKLFQKICTQIWNYSQGLRSGHSKN